MSVRTRRQIYLNSKDKDEDYSSNSTFNSNMRFYLNQPIHIPPEYNLAVSLINFQCPISWGNINNYNDTLTINGNTQTVNTGNYNITELIDELNTKFTNKATFANDENTNRTIIIRTSSSYTVNNESFTLNSTIINLTNGTYTETELLTEISNQIPTGYFFEYVNNVYQFRTSIPSSFNESDLFTLEICPALTFLGFLNNKYTSVYEETSPVGIPTPITNYTITASPNAPYNVVSNSMLNTLGFTNFSPNTTPTIISNGICDMSGFPYLVLRTNFHTKNVSSFSKRPMNILAHIPINNDDYLSYEQGDSEFLVNNKDINFIDIILQTPDHKDIDLRGINFSLTLEINFEKVENENE